MEIYIEYAFLENFIFDGVLLWLAMKAAKVAVIKRRLVLSAICGAVFAVIFPLLRLSERFSIVLKLSFGFLLCLVLFSNIKTKKDWGRYMMTVFFFFAFSFGFGGSLLGVYGFSLISKDGYFSVGQIPPIAVLLGFTVLLLTTLYFVHRVYARRRILREVYDCRILKGDKLITTAGFLDSGNLACKDGIPVCFLSPEVVYELWGNELFSHEEPGQVFDEMEIITINGVSKIFLYQAELTVFFGGEEIQKTVYFSPSKNMISREYKILLNARIFEKQSGELI